MQNTATINISLPIVLKAQAEGLVAKGYFASFSDLVRSALRWTVNSSVYDVLGDIAEKERAAGKTTIMNSVADVDAYMDKICK